MDTADARARLSAVLGIATGNDWRWRAACRSEDPELFFDAAPTALRVPSQEAVLRRGTAKEVCARCPVRTACLSAHLDEPFGVFGGMDQDERKALRATQKKLRPETRRRIGRIVYDLRRRGTPWADIAVLVNLPLDRARAALATWKDSPEGRSVLAHAAALEELRRGATVAQAAEAGGISLREAADLARKHSLGPAAEKPLTEDQVREIHRLAEAGMPVRSISISTGIPDHRVHTVVRKWQDSVRRPTPDRPCERDGWALHHGTWVQAEYLGENHEGDRLYYLKLDLGRGQQTRTWVRDESIEWVRRPEKAVMLPLPQRRRKGSRAS